MKNLVARLLIGVALALVAIHPASANAQNQNEMNQQASRDFEKADTALNKIYKQLMAKLDEESQVKLKAVQRAWVQFRDAEAEFQADLEARGGSMAPLIYNGTRATITTARIKALEKLLKENGN